MPTDHRTPIRESYERRIAQMRAMLALRSYTVGDLPDDATALLREHLGDDAYAELLPGHDASDDAYDIADAYVLAVETYHKRDADTGTINTEPSRAEITLGVGGPTVVITYDERGAGWSEFFHSWGKENASDESNDRTEWPLSEEDHETVAEWLRTFAGGWDC